MLEDVAFRIARDGVAKVELYEGKPVIVDGKRLYEVKYDTSLLMKLLAGRDREKYASTRSSRSTGKIGMVTFRS